MEVKCIQCGTPVNVHDMPEPQIMNTPGASLILLEHPKPSVCIGCKATVAVRLVGANLHLDAAPVVPAQKSPIIVASTMPKNGKH